MISLLDFLYCALGIHVLSKEIEYRDGEGVQRCEGCKLIFQSRMNKECLDLMNEELDKSDRRQTEMAH